ncbi:hypothetical protein AcV5_008238 [Taiwanofungus camphoratus]|nr:hypothetical protein AcV5_008238 [Antrodia cinnamomea]KAI0955618.1 hypothetical protein AcV7_006236 [Antrodia cinnamomea]
MPTATATAEANSPAVISVKASASSPAAASSTAATLRSLYPRAARAFLQRNVAVTHSLLTSAFSILQPPLASAPDSVASQRKKWEILRITFETTLYSSPPSSQDPEELPTPLRANLMLSPEPFIATIHTRSLHLFTPVSPPQKSTSAFLPAQILVTLVLASLKLECTIVGRGMIEDWLARHGQEDIADPDGYAKVLELYCLHVLPRLEEWEYAEDFLEYERELPADTRKYMITSLRNLHAQAMATHRQPTPQSISQSITEPSPPSSRSVSPARSTSSASSSSSTSTHTATPRMPHPKKGTNTARLRTVARLTPASASTSSQSISSTATSSTATPATVQRQRSPAHRTKAHRGTEPPGTQLSPVPRAPRAHPLQAPTPPQAPSTLALLRSSLDALLQSASRTKLTAWLLFIVAFPLLSFVFQLRRRRTRIAAGSAPPGGGAAEEVRRRLRSAALLEGKGGAGGILWRLWQEFLRAVSDTVQMGGRGLV